MSIKDEVNEFIDSMIEKGILKDYLTENRDTVRKIIEEELIEQQLLEYFRKQIADEEKELGRKEATKKVIQTLLSRKMPISQIAYVIELSEEEVIDMIEELQS